MDWFWKKRKNDKEINRLQDELKHNIFLSNETKEITINKIEDIIDSKNISLDKFLATKEGKALMFQLLLHKQRVGYHAEILRRLSVKEDHIVSLWDYEEQTERKVANEEMEFQLQQFIEEYKPYLKEVLKLDVIN